mgnify:CR=1 FL=1
MASPLDRGGRLSDPLTIDLALAGARAALGVGLLVAPGSFASIIVGDAARSPGAKLLSRAAGVRDVSMAVVSIWALDRPDDLPRTHRLHAIVDACDAAAGVMAFRHLTPVGKAFAVLGGSSSAITGYVQSRRWRHSTDGAGAAA